MKIEERICKVKCRNQDCPNPDPAKIFTFSPGDYMIKIPLGRRRRQFKEEILIATCDHCQTKKRIRVHEEDPDDKVY